jgi:hypothetical protein
MHRIDVGYEISDFGSIGFLIANDTASTNFVLFVRGRRPRRPLALGEWPIWFKF